MFVPRQYNVDDDAWPVEIMRTNPLALLVTGADPVPWATHLPVIVPSGPEIPAAARAGGSLAGCTLLGHMNRANPHWQALTPGARSLLIFGGPHGYVSPTVYATTPAAPTWNFTAVHVHGTVHPISDFEETLAVVRATVAMFEGAFGADWDATGSVDYFRQILPGVGAFAYRIDRVDAMFKLSQEQEPEIRRRVARSFAESPTGTHRELADLMSRVCVGRNGTERSVEAAE